MARQQKETNYRELEKLGEHVRNMFELGYTNPKRVLWFSFIKGIVSGVGVFLGSTVVITIVWWLLSIFTNIPFVDRLVNLLSGETPNF
jgi:Domain of unknown function (DUF5665)